jgi:DtxR family Mn-dependent transcriptional regulator
MAQNEDPEDRAMINPNIEEVLENLYLVETESASPRSGTGGPTALADAAQGGYVELAEGRPTLTDIGRRAGRDVVRRHRLAECLLKDVLNVQGDRMDEDACGFEHILQRGLDDKICTLLGHPRTCPHGLPIPPGLCCEQAQQDSIREVQALCDGTSGQEGTIAYLSTRESRDIQKLMAMGILPGVKIRLLRQFPSYVFEIGYSQFTVDRALAEKIYVHWKT